MDAQPFTPETLAQRWQTSPQTVRRLCRSKKLGHFRLGKEIRIPAKAVQEYETCSSALSRTEESGQPQSQQEASGADSAPATTPPQKIVKLPNGRRVKPLIV